MYRDSPSNESGTHPKHEVLLNLLTAHSQCAASCTSIYLRLPIRQNADRFPSNIDHRDHNHD